MMEARLDPASGSDAGSSTFGPRPRLHANARHML